jgi:transposase-like protein
LKFEPTRCPFADCASRTTTTPFLWRKKGTFVRECDRQRVQRFLCRVCSRTFSTQTFRVDYRLVKPTLHYALFDLFISKVTHRQSARLLGCDRKTIAHRLELMSAAARCFQKRVLDGARARGGLAGDFQLDELETFEHSRRLAPVTMPVLIELHSYFVLYAETAPLPARGNLRPADRKRKEAREKIEGPRKSGSREAVERTLRFLEYYAPKQKSVAISSDHKTSYASLVRTIFGTRARHARHSSTAQRSYSNPMFPINLTLAMLRDGVSRLVRRNWGASKKRQKLEQHVWIWIAYRNYVRWATNEVRTKSSAMLLGLVDGFVDKFRLFGWRADLVE